MQGWRTFGMQKDFLRHMAFTAILIFFSCISFVPPVSVLGRICVYIHVSDFAEIVYELSLLPNNTASETFLHKSGKSELSNGYLLLRHQPGSNWVNEWHWTKGFTISFSNRKWQQPQLLPNFLPHHTP